MMKYIKYSIAALMVSAALCSCGNGVQPYGDGILMTINTGSLQTKGDYDGLDALNENAIRSVDYFIYAADSSGVPKNTGHLDVDVTRTLTFKIDLKSSTFNEVFGSNTAMIYAVVNLPESSVIPSGATLEQVKAITATAAFNDAAVQDCFLMSGSGTLTSTSGIGGSGEVTVKRVAAKITYNFTTDEYCLEDEKDPESTKWYSHPDNIKVEFHNLRNAAVVGATTQAAGAGSNFSYAERTAAGNGTYNSKTQYAPSPYYTYPVSWEIGSEYEPYILVTMPLTKDSADGTDRRDCYYKIILPVTQFDRNCWYNFRIDLKMLGSFDKEVPTVEMPDGSVFYVVDWGGKGGNHGQTADGDFVAIRYLTVESNTYPAYNVETLEIPINTSHECEIVNATVEHDEYTGSNTGNIRTTHTYSLADIEASITVSGGIITLSHVLHNDITKSTLDMTPYTFHFTVRHEDDASYAQEMTIVQTPAIIVTHEENTAGRYNSSSTSNEGNNIGEGSRGDVYVNGQVRNIYNSTNPAYNTVRYRNLNDKRMYMYVIETLVQPQNSTYIITDPRLGSGHENELMVPPMSNGTDIGTSNGVEINSSMSGTYVPLFSSTNAYSVLTDPGLNNGPSVYQGENRKMAYYYSTRTDTATDNCISPKFRIASNFSSAGDVSSSSGVTNANVSYLAMARRCATYQEAGYPAGRWRLPTYAEVEYTIALQKLGKIPTIFGNNPYFTASKIIVVGERTQGITSTRTVDNFANGSTRTSIRCVYDDWYWENTANGGKVAKDTFTWGDMPRSTTE